ncbi:MAG: hypothetical protein ACP6IS_12450 [Candidatus Asgardarchaeia archaeon]
MVMSQEDWNKELLENMKKTTLILEAVQNLEERIDKFENKLDKILTMNGAQDVSIGKFQEQLAMHETEITRLKGTIGDLSKKYYKMLGIFSGIILTIQFIINFVFKLVGK